MLLLIAVSLLQAANFDCESYRNDSTALKRCLSRYATDLLDEAQPEFDRMLRSKLQHEQQWSSYNPFGDEFRISLAKPLNAYQVSISNDTGCDLLNSDAVSVDGDAARIRRIGEIRRQIEAVTGFLFEFHLANNGQKTSQLFQIQQVHLCAVPYQPVVQEKARDFAFTDNTLRIQVPSDRLVFLDWGYKPLSADEIFKMWNSGLQFKPNRIIQRREMLNYSLFRLWPLLNPTGKIRIFVRKYLAEKNIDRLNRVHCPQGSCSRLLSDAADILEPESLEALRSLSDREHSSMVEKIGQHLFDKMDLRIEQMGMAAIDNPDVSIDIERDTRFSIVNIQNAHIINVSAFLGSLGGSDKEFLDALKRHSPGRTNHDIDISTSNGVSLVNVDTFDYVNINVALFHGLAIANFYRSLKQALD